MIPEEERAASEHQAPATQPELRSHPRHPRRPRRRSPRRYPPPEKREDGASSDPISAKSERPQQNSAIRAAIAEVKQIADSLEAVLEDLHHVLGVLEQAEQQKNATEKEVEELRRELKALDQPRERTQHYKALAH